MSAGDILLKLVLRLSTSSGSVIATLGRINYAALRVGSIQIVGTVGKIGLYSR